MRTLIVYASKYGCTEKAVNRLADYLGEGTQLLNLINEDNKIIKLEEYDTVVVGGSIHAGNIQKEVKKFCEVTANEIILENLYVVIIIIVLGGSGLQDVLIKI
ncbi:MAG: flavodoxin domain-containing protein [Halanaerobiales bacterium]